MLPITIKHLRMHQSRTMLFLFARERPIPQLIILFLVSKAPGDSAAKSSCKLAFSNIWMFEWRSGKADFEESFCEDNIFSIFSKFPKRNEVTDLNHFFQTSRLWGVHKKKSHPFFHILTLSWRHASRTAKMLHRIRFAITISQKISFVFAWTIEIISLWNVKNIKEINKSFKITLQDTLIYKLDVDSFKYSLISCIVTPGKHFAILKHF